MTRITQAQLDDIITASDKQGPDINSQTYSADAFDATVDNTGDTDLLLLALNQTRSRNIRLMKLFQFV
ncbi:hypothetical protein [Weissella hellenica]|uniref:hypothetical protein n=1 Tax=Weissella hellenica TaxID=46256 RepID=UPI003883A27D